MISDFLTPRQATGSSQWRPYAPPTNALTSMAAPSNPVADAYTSMFGRTDDGFGDGVSSGVSSGVSPGSKGSVSYGQAPDYSRTYAKNLGRAGTVIGAFTGMPAGMIGTGIGLGIDHVNANNLLSEYGLQTLGPEAYANAALNAATQGYAGQSYEDMQNQGFASAWDEVGSPPGAYNSGWGTKSAIGGYGFSDFGPVGGFGFDDAQPEGFSGFGSDTESAGGRGNDGYGDENDSGYGDDTGGPDGGL